MNQDFLTLEEVAKVLDKSVQTVRRLIKKGELAAKRTKTPQGFQYVVNREEIFSNLDTKKPILPQQEERKSSLTNQTQILTSQNDFEALIENDFYAIDRNSSFPSPSSPSNEQLMKIIELQHKENVMLIHILERSQDELYKLQAELYKDKLARPSLVERIWRKFFSSL